MVVLETESPPIDFVKDRQTQLKGLHAPFHVQNPGVGLLLRTFALLEVLIYDTLFETLLVLNRFHEGARDGVQRFFVDLVLALVDAGPELRLVEAIRMQRRNQVFLHRLHGDTFHLLLVKV